MRYNAYLKAATLLSVFMSSIVVAASLPGNLVQCRTIDNDAKRLACYDLALERLATDASQLVARPAQDVTPVAQPTAKQFGQEHLKAGQKDKPQQLEQLEAQVVSIKKAPYKKQIITLSNGQVWKMVAKQLRVKTDETIYIKRGILSAYYMGKPGINKTVRVKRLQ